MKKVSVSDTIDKIKNSTAFRAARLVKNIICWILILILAITMVIFLTTRIQGNTPTVFGYTIFRISTGSMEPELMIGDVILDKVMDDETEIAVGDVVTFEGGSQFDGKLVTHKVIKAPYTDENGNTMLQTHGIANELDDTPISIDQVRAKMICKIPYIDTLYNLFLSPCGLLIMILLIILVFIDEIINIVKILSGRNETRLEDIGEIIDRIQSEKPSENRSSANESISKQIEDDT
ncbi:MAG TPA: signal peptidase I [Ruminococcus sp.]|nr:signal peptidase I [Ruminococcus sp.]